jgi:hypothetical protein
VPALIIVDLTHPQPIGHRPSLSLSFNLRVRAVS